MYQQRKYKFLTFCLISALLVCVLFLLCSYPFLLINQFNNQYIYEYIRNGENNISDSYIIDFSRKITIAGLYEEDSEKLEYFNCDFIYNITPVGINSYYCTGVMGDADSNEDKKIFLLKIQSGNLSDFVEINFLPQQLIVFNEKLYALAENREAYSLFSVDLKNKQVNETVNSISFAQETANRLFVYQNCIIYPKTKQEKIVWYSFDGTESRVFDTTAINEYYVTFLKNGNLLKFNLSDNTFYDIDNQKLWCISEKGEYKAEHMTDLDDRHILLKITKSEKDFPVSFYVLSLDNGNATDVTKVFTAITYGDKPDLITVM